MLKLHTKDGATVRIDLADKQQVKQFLESLKDRDFQATITGIAILQKCSGKFRCPGCNRSKRLVCAHCGRNESAVVCDKSVQFSLSRPQGFGQILYHAEGVEMDDESGMKGGEKVTCFVDDVRVTMMVHNGQPSTRFTLLKTGKQRYNPFVE